MLSGCVGISQYVPAKDLTNIKQISVGQDKAEVAQIMREQVTIGYEKDEKTKTFNPIVLKNPYRIELIKAGGRSYEVYFYFTAVKQPDDIVSDDELTPLVFDEDRLAGQGWPFLNQLRRKDRY